MDRKDRDILDALPDPTYVIDLDYTVSYANEAARRASGGGPPGLRCYEMSHRRATPCEGADHGCPMREVLRTGHSFRVRHTHFAGDGSTAFVDIHAAPIRDDAGQVVQIVESCRDITSMVSAERELQHQREILEQQVHERTQHLAAALARLQEMASTDLLTGVGNRRRLLDLLSREIERSRRHERRTALLMIDLDDFKRINDDLGHTQGDGWLRAVADRIRATIRVSDVLTRWGGDEFVVLAPESGIEEAKNLARRISASLGEACLGTVSIGAAELAPGDTAEFLIHRADSALIAAKREGKNRVAAAPSSGGIVLLGPA